MKLNEFIGNLEYLKEGYGDIEVLWHEKKFDEYYPKIRSIVVKKQENEEYVLILNGHTETEGIVDMIYCVHEDDDE